jgi:hypothetical protein
MPSNHHCSANGVQEFSRSFVIYGFHRCNVHICMNVRPFWNTGLANGVHPLPGKAYHVSDVFVFFKFSKAARFDGESRDC